MSTSNTDREQASSESEDELLDERTDVSDDDETVQEEISKNVLRGRIDELEAENSQLRAAYAATKRQRYQRTAVGLFVIGILGVGAGVGLSGTQSVLFAIGATGLFAGILTYYLTPERFIAADVGGQVAQAHTETLAGFIQTLGLSGTTVYVPTSMTATGRDTIMFVPQIDPYEIPPELAPGVVSPTSSRERGIGIVPTGRGLYTEFNRAVSGQMPTEPVERSEQLSEAITEQFELATNVEADVATYKTEDMDTETDAETDDTQSERRRLTVSVTEPAFTTATTIDHPIASFTATVIAEGLSQPVECNIDQELDTGDTYQFTLSWEYRESDTNQDENDIFE